MIRTLTTLAISGLLTSGLTALAQANPCEQIVNACKSAKFVDKTANAGTGLWVDCIRPIMQGQPQPKKAKLALPTVDPSIVAACKAKHPKFGEGK